MHVLKLETTKSNSKYLFNKWNVFDKNINLLEK